MGPKVSTTPYNKITKNPYDDPLDHYDSVKWDFPEDSLQIVYHEGYPYKIRSGSDYKRLEFLVNVRKMINRICQNILMNLNSKDLNKLNLNKIDKETMDGIHIFLDIHGEFERTSVPEIFKDRLKNYGTCSKYLLSDTPISKKEPFVGLNKPKFRHITNEPPVGKDTNIRAMYRDIFLDPADPSLELIIHELAHTMANHVRFRPDDHHADFKKYEKIITLAYLRRK